MIVRKKLQIPIPDPVSSNLTLPSLFGSQSSPKNSKLCYKLPPGHSDSLSISKTNLECWKIQESAVKPGDLTSLSSFPDPRDTSFDVLVRHKSRETEALG